MSKAKTNKIEKVALITGVTGQDGSYLSELLLSKNYEVHGIIRRSSIFTTNRIDHLRENKNFHLHYGDLTDSSNLNLLLRKINPEEIYNLGAQSHVQVSFEVPEYTAEVDALGTIRILSAIRDLNMRTKYYQASTSELFGGLPTTAPQSESTPFYPKSPYGVAKLYAHWITINYREAYGIYACNGILFNHESPRRSENFVTKKITKAVASIYQKKQDVLYLGNLDAKRDWGYAKEFVECIWLILQQESADDYVVSTGKTHTVREFVEFAFEVVGIKINWHGNGASEIGIDLNTGNTLVKIDPRYYRPSEVELLLGDSSKAYKNLGWKAKMSVKDLAKMMVQYDLENETYGGPDHSL